MAIQISSFTNVLCRVARSYANLEHWQIANANYKGQSIHYGDMQNLQPPFDLASFKIEDKTAFDTS